MSTIKLYSITIGKIFTYADVCLIVNSRWKPYIVCFGCYLELCQFCVVIFSIPATRANDLQLQRISIPDLFHYFFVRTSISLLMLSAKQGNYLYHFYNVFGMTRSLTGDWTWDLAHLKPVLYHHRGGVGLLDNLITTLAWWSAVWQPVVI